MPVVIPLRECLARPEGEGFPGLVEHLEAVAHRCGNPTGDPVDRMAFLAGLLHDIGKCQASWQAYVRGRRRRGPPHAPLGAVLFWYLAEKLVPRWSTSRQERRVLHSLAMDWVRAIYGHHGDLPDLEERPPWEKYYSAEEIEARLAECDLQGIFALVGRWFPVENLPPSRLGEWLRECGDGWEHHKLLVLPTLLKGEGEETDSERALLLPRLADRLVVADRYHAAGFRETSLEPREAAEGVQNLVRFCEERAAQAVGRGASSALVKHRQRLQDEAVERYRRNRDASFFALTLPTGYGKTLTSLRVALEACRGGECERVVYVAPYISILSQAALEMARASGLEVVTHHHLSPLEMGDEGDVDVLDTWQAPVVATTFNQFFRALFPLRAQECLRREALHRAFIIVDEPQIIDTAVWNLFLRVLESSAQEWGCRVLFATATLPPLELGLRNAAVPLAGGTEASGRFALRYSAEKWDPDDTARAAFETLERQGNVAVVLNTVRDATEVYGRLKEAIPQTPAFCLTGQMLPYHKAGVIAGIRQAVDSGKPVAVMCTQILEAGVDLSFRAILRALPVLPSVVQVAGRANRHGEGQRATVTVFRYVRDDGRDTRGYVYVDETARRQTDALLEAHPEVHEEETHALLREYYERCFQENEHCALLQKLREAALGRWSELAGIEPFGSVPGGVEVFVPWPEAMKEAAVADAMKRLSISSPRELLDRFLDLAFKRSLSHADRRRLSGLLHRFTVPMQLAQASKIAKDVNGWLWEITHPDLYSEEMGLAHIRAAPDDAGSLIL